MEDLDTTIRASEQLNKFRLRHLDAVEENESFEATSSILKQSFRLSKPPAKGKGVALPQLQPGPSPPDEATPGSPASTCTSQERSKYVDAPADERDDIIAALAWEQQHERHIKTKARWEMSEDYLAELDSLAPSILQEKFHLPITTLSEQYFSKIPWRLLASRITSRTEGLRSANSYFPAYAKLPCTPGTWPALVTHPAMSSPLFIEGIIANTIAGQMCHCPALQAETDLAAYLDTFYYYCKSIGPGTLDAAEWMALTLQMMHKMVYPDRTDPRYKHQGPIPEVKTVEESAQTRDIVWALCDTVRLLRAAVGMPLATGEAEELLTTVTELVVSNFKLSVEWHMKPLAFRQQGSAWHLKQSVEYGAEMYDLSDEDVFLTNDPIDATIRHHVVAVISPTLIREEWDKPDNAWWQGKVWMKPRLLIAPGPPTISTG